MKIEKEIFAPHAPVERVEIVLDGEEASALRAALERWVSDNRHRSPDGFAVVDELRKRLTML